MKLEDLEGSELLDFYNAIYYTERPEDCMVDIFEFFAELANIKNISNGTLYALCDCRMWEPEAYFYADYKALEEAFARQYVRYVQPWEELDDEDLEEWLDRINDKELDGLRQRVFNCDDEEDEE